MSCQIVNPPSPARGFTGPTGPAAVGGLSWALGEGPYSVAVGAGNDIVVSAADVPTTTGPGKAVLVFSGTNDGNDRVVLPAPATDADAYNIAVENQSVSALTFAISPTSNPGTSAVIALGDIGTTEESFRQAVIALAAGPSDARDYRTFLRVAVSGVYRLPGYTLGT